MRVSLLKRLLPAVALVLPLAAPAAVDAASSAKEPAAVPTPRVLQMNLCNSGLAAHCWDDKPGSNETRAALTMKKAVEVIEKVDPDIVTLNEVCEDDLEYDGGLKEAIGFQGDSFFAEHKLDPETGKGGPYTCGGERNGGGDYGSAILTRDPLPEPYSEHRFEKLFYAQYDGASEQRVMGCRKMTGFTACTGQLNNMKGDEDYNARRNVTRGQCAELVGRAGDFAAGQPVIVAGDLNLHWSSEKPDEQRALRDCIDVDHDGNADYTRKSDGGVQQVITTGSFGEDGTHVEDMGDWTDHPALWADLTL